MNITLKNYRCFPDSSPATFCIHPGFIAFIGPNNAGKSTLLKFFYEFRGLFRAITLPWLTSAVNGNRNPFDPPPVRDISEVFCNKNERDLVIELSDFTPTDENRRIGVERVVLTVPRPTNTATAECWVAGDQLTARQQITVQNDTTWAVDGANVDLGPLLAECASATRTLYVGAFRNILNIGSNENYYDIKTGQAFVSQWRDRKGETTKQSSRDSIRITDDIRRIFDYESLEINSAIGDTTLQLIVDRNPYMLSEVGSGIAQFIAVLANAAAQKPDYILIDEPELNLHPTLQLDFLTALASYATKGILFSTHSVGLAKSTAETIYTVRRREEGSSEVRLYEEVSSLAEFVGELGFSGYNELGFSKLLLVEGPSELKAIEQFLRMARKNHKIVMLQLGGSSMIHGSVAPQLEELRRITTSIAALIDSEKASADADVAPSRLAFREACLASGISCHILERRAMENYFTDAAIKQAIGPSASSLGPYEKLGEHQPSWGKANNWRIAHDMTLHDLEENDLGTFIASL
jgi:AAA15 family ATPase/GTPase